MVKRQLSRLEKFKGKGLNDQPQPSAASNRRQIGETTDHPRTSAKVEANLLERLTNSSRLRALVGGVYSSSREGQMARPRVLGMFRPMNQQHLCAFRAISKNHRNGGPPVALQKAGLKIDQLVLQAFKPEFCIIKWGLIAQGWVALLALTLG